MSAIDVCISEIVDAWTRGCAADVAKHTQRFNDWQREQPIELAIKKSEVLFDLLEKKGFKF